MRQPTVQRRRPESAILLPSGLLRALIDLGHRTFLMINAFVYVNRNGKEREMPGRIEHSLSLGTVGQLTLRVCMSLRAQSESQPKLQEQTILDPLKPTKEK